MILCETGCGSAPTSGSGPMSISSIPTHWRRPIACSAMRPTWISRSHADVLIVTGAATGLSIHDSHLAALYGKVGVPVLVGSGVTEHSVGGLVGSCDGFIVGTALKDELDLHARINVEKTRALRQARDAAIASSGNWPKKSTRSNGQHVTTGGSRRSAIPRIM